MYVGVDKEHGIMDRLNPISVLPVVAKSPAKPLDQGPDLTSTAPAQPKNSICTALWINRADNSFRRSGINVW